MYIFKQVSNEAKKFQELTKKRVTSDRFAARSSEIASFSGFALI